MARRVAVIGAGSSGLVCIKTCLDEGLEVVCFESSDDIGGLWRFKENPEPNRASIYHSVIINTSKEKMCYSDFPIPAEYPNYMHHSRIMEYFRMYAEHFQLINHICFKTTVLKVSQRPDFSHSGQWDVETENSEGKQQKHIFDAVMICIGHHCHPNMPLHDFTGIETFKGVYFHSRNYKTPEQWRNKKVVVIGIGNSGGDIAVELSRVTKQVYLSTRRGAWIRNRVGDNGWPWDMTVSRALIRLRSLLPFNLVCNMVERSLNQRFNHRLYNLKPKHRLFSQHPTVSDDLPNRILSGTVQVKPNIRRFQGSSVEFDDGSVVENIDLVVGVNTITHSTSNTHTQCYFPIPYSLSYHQCDPLVLQVFATGYSFSFPFLASNVLPVSGNKASLYKYVFPPDLERNTLAVIGLVQPLGAIMPISEIQARWATRVFKGCCKCPSVAAMLKEVECKQETMARRYVSSPRHTIQVDFVDYMDEVADQFGVRPSILRLFLTDPRVALSVLFGPSTPYQYRLRGPGKWAGARQAILTQWDRVIQPMMTNGCNHPEPKRSVLVPLALLAAALGVASYYNRNSLPSIL